MGIRRSGLILALMQLKEITERVLAARKSTNCLKILGVHAGITIYLSRSVIWGTLWLGQA